VTTIAIASLDDLHAAYAERNRLLDEVLEAEAAGNGNLAKQIKERRDALFDAIEDYEEVQCLAEAETFHSSDPAI
jgi:hypothetical protein